MDKQTISTALHSALEQDFGYGAIDHQLSLWDTSDLQVMNSRETGMFAGDDEVTVHIQWEPFDYSDENEFQDKLIAALAQLRNPSRVSDDDFLTLAGEQAMKHWGEAGDFFKYHEQYATEQLAELLSQFLGKAVSSEDVAAVVSWEHSLDSREADILRDRAVDFAVSKES